MCAQGQASSAADTDVASEVDFSNSTTELKVKEQRGQPREASRLTQEKIKRCLN